MARATTIPPQSGLFQDHSDTTRFQLWRNIMLSMQRYGVQAPETIKTIKSSTLALLQRDIEVKQQMLSSELDNGNDVSTLIKEIETARAEIKRMQQYDWANEEAMMRILREMGLNINTLIDNRDNPGQTQWMPHTVANERQAGNPLATVTIKNTIYIRENGHAQGDHWDPVIDGVARPVSKDGTCGFHTIAMLAQAHMLDAVKAMPALDPALVAQRRPVYVATKKSTAFDPIAYIKSFWQALFAKQASTHRATQRSQAPAVVVNAIPLGVMATSITVPSASMGTHVTPIPGVVMSTPLPPSHLDRDNERFAANNDIIINQRTIALGAKLASMHTTQLASLLNTGRQQEANDPRHQSKYLSNMGQLPNDPAQYRQQLINTLATAGAHMRTIGLLIMQTQPLASHHQQVYAANP